MLVDVSCSTRSPGGNLVDGGAKHSPPGLWVAFNSESGGHQHCCKKVTCCGFSDVPRIGIEIATVVSNVSRATDSMYVLVF